MFTFAPVCAHLSWWCLNSLFYRILTNLTCSILNEAILEPTSPLARHRPREPVSHPAWSVKVLVAGHRVHPTGERQRPVREFLDILPLRHSTQETEHESLHEFTCSMTLDLTVLLEIYLLNWYRFVLLFISLRQVVPTLAYARNIKILKRWIIGKI